MTIPRAQVRRFVTPSRSHGPTWQVVISDGARPYRWRPDKTLSHPFMRRSHGFVPVIHTPELLEVVREDWRALRPFLDWGGGRLRASHRALRSQPFVNDAIVRSGSQKAFIDATRPSSFTT